MNKKAILGGIGVVVAAVIAFVVYKAVSLQNEAAKWSGPMKEIVDEKITHDDKVTHAQFVSLIDAPVQAVQNAIWNVENSPQMVENIKAATLLESSDNTKKVEMNFQSLNLPLQSFIMQWNLYPDQHRITFKTLKSQAQDIEGEYKLEGSPDGTKTRLTYTSTITDKIAVPIPQSVLDSANRELYVNTVRGITKTVKHG